jgi:hypothetical protein
MPFMFEKVEIYQKERPLACRVGMVTPDGTVSPNLQYGVPGTTAEFGMVSPGCRNTFARAHTGPRRG